MNWKRLVVITALFQWNAASGLALELGEEVLLPGKKAYDAYCARCHGTEGRGDGYDAKRLYVPPRDLTSGMYKFKTTATGTPPSDTDLIKGILGHGVTGSGMPSFANLEEDVKNAVVQYIKIFSTAFDGPTPEPIAEPPNKRAPVDLNKGKELFAKLQCALCHGENGRANGSSAATLTDGWGYPIRPANLTQGWTYGGGPKPMDIYYRIMAGIEGGTMPSYDGAVTPEEAWILSQYVASLQLDANWSDSIDIFESSKPLPMGADDSVWSSAPRTDVVLDGYFVQGGKRLPFTVNAISVQAVANSEGVVFRLVWDDPVLAENSPPDALLMALRSQDFEGDARDNLHNLTAPDSPPLDWLYWRSNEEDSFRQKKSNLNAAAGSSWSAAKRPGASASFDDGRWTLLLPRAFKDELPDLGAVRKHPIRIGFAVWDGNNNETRLRMPRSQWVWLRFPDKEPKH